MTLISRRAFACFVLGLGQCTFSGCLGIGIFWPSSYEVHVNPEAQLNFEEIKDFISEEEARASFESLHGEPVSIEELDPFTTRYTYNVDIKFMGIRSGVRWVGIVIHHILPFLPIPLAIPIGRETVSFTSRHGRLIGEDGEFQKGYFFGVDLYWKNYKLRYGPRSEVHRGEDVTPRYLKVLKESQEP